MNITLRPEQEKLIKAKVDSGQYTTADEVIAEALQLLEQRDRQYQKWLEETRQKVSVGLAQLDRGEGIDVQTVINHLKERVNIAKEKLKETTE
ncbi:MAG: type II toxin-antitoxin system ParD family antitoxin [Merismopedia sp. SIO2A8]|nr:type II toxin-antitoxin system ParD family antitoxin [Merismopedia sp. SIO2A8]